MELFKLTIKGFRCFSSESTATIEFDRLTAFVGANGAGKSAALMALVRMFGATNAQRTLTREDFFVRPIPEQTMPGDPVALQTPEATSAASTASEAAGPIAPRIVPQSVASTAIQTKLELRIEAWFKFPELMSDDAAATSKAIPECIKHIFVTESKQSPPICRIRLDGTWSMGPTAEGDIDQKMVWVKSDADDAPDDKTQPLGSPERRLIQALYVPATRDAVRELRAVSGTLLSRVLKHIRWPDDLKAKVVELDRELTAAVRAEATLGELETTLREHWTDLFGTASTPSLAFADADLAGILGRLDANVHGPVGKRPIELLSEGERSLLYFALMESTLKLEASLAERGQLLPDGGPRPVLTLLAIEEPENHLAPQYLGRIVKAIRTLIGTGNVQAILASHSASIMRRIEPVEVRHFRTDKKGARYIKRISLPENKAAEFKYVREAVKAHPELYFASAIVLGEGPSEEIVLPRIAKALKLDIDPRFVAVVPLGGRHVHHFWRLLHDIGTPFVTLLDLDLERHGGGWERIRELINELGNFGRQAANVCDGVSVEQVGQTIVPITDPTFDSWIKHLEAHDIFLSAPLDLDLAMLSSFFDAYKKIAPQRGGPDFPKPGRSKRSFVERVQTNSLTKADKAYIELRTRQVLGAQGSDGTTYGMSKSLLFPWYEYFFGSNGSKPAVHNQAIVELDDETLEKGAPAVLRRLVKRVEGLVPK